MTAAHSEGSETPGGSKAIIINISIAGKSPILRNPSRMLPPELCVLCRNMPQNRGIPIEMKLDICYNVRIIIIKKKRSIAYEPKKCGMDFF